MGAPATPRPAAAPPSPPRSGEEGFQYASSELEAMAQAQNYYRWIARRMAPHLGSRIVEVGAGIGTFSRHLLGAHRPAELRLMEPAANNFRVLRERFGGEAGVRVVPEYLDAATEAGSADTVVAVNVMEHIPDDAAFLADVRRVLVPGGKLLLFVPALPALFGTLDEAFEHVRRYTRSGLVRLLHGAGLDPLDVRYANLPGTAAWWLSGKVLRRRTIPARDARLYDRWVVPLVAAVEDRWPPPLGQSLLAVAQRDPQRPSAG